MSNKTETAVTREELAKALEAKKAALIAKDQAACDSIKQIFEPFFRPDEAHEIDFDNSGCFTLRIPTANGQSNYCFTMYYNKFYSSERRRLTMHVSSFGGFGSDNRQLIRLMAIQYLVASNLERIEGQIAALDWDGYDALADECRDLRRTIADMENDERKRGIAEVAKQIVPDAIIKDMRYNVSFVVVSVTPKLVRYNRLMDDGKISRPWNRGFHQEKISEMVKSLMNGRAAITGKMDV